MLKLWDLLKRWLPVLVMMWVAFSASGDSQSVTHSSRIIEPLVRWLFPNVTGQTLSLVILCARKGAHMTEYGILALLLWRAVRSPLAATGRRWKWSEAGLALFIAGLYASTDEFHQTFVAGREGSIRDVLIDLLGAAIALMLLWFFGRWSKKW